MEHSIKEVQRYDDKLVDALLVLGIVGALIGLVRSALNGADPSAMIVYAALAALLAVLLYGLHQWTLKLSVNQRRIKVKVLPWRGAVARIPWSSVRSCRIVRTPGLAGWLGGNVHFGDVVWLSLVGRNGLEIETDDGTRYFIGCRDVDRVAKLVETLRIGRDAA